MLKKSRKLDAVILGGGIAALGTGYALVRRGKKVLFIVPPRPLRGESTPASAGILDPFLESDRLDRPFFRFKKAAFLDFKKQVRRLEQATGIKTGFLPCGMFFTAFTPAEERQLKARGAVHRCSGIPVRWVPRAEALKKWPALAAQVRGVLFYPTIARILPVRLQSALQHFIRCHGGRWLRTSRKAVPWVRGGKAAGVKLGGRSIAADSIIHASGSWAGKKNSLWIPLPVEPMRGQIVLLSGKIRGLGAIAHSAHGIYVVPWEKKRYLLGSTVERAGFNARANARDLRRIRAEAARMIPALSGLKQAACWAGLRPCSKDRLPLIGETRIRGYYTAAGYFRSGIVIGIRAGELLAQGILQKRMPAVLRPFSPRRSIRRKP